MPADSEDSKESQNGLPVCKACEAALQSGEGVLLRWRDAKVLLVGCKEHIAEITNAFTDHQDQKIKFLKIVKGH